MTKETQKKPAPTGNREAIATAAMVGLLSRGHDQPNKVAALAVLHADALIKELAPKETE